MFVFRLISRMVELLNRQGRQLAAAKDKIHDRARTHDRREHRRQDADHQRNREALDRASTEGEQHDRRDQCGDIGIGDRRQRLLVAGVDRRLRGGPVAKFFSYSLEDQHVGVHGHADREHDAGDTRHRQGRAQHRQQRNQQHQQSLQSQRNQQNRQLLQSQQKLLKELYQQKLRNQLWQQRQPSLHWQLKKLYLLRLQKLLTQRNLQRQQNQHLVLVHQHPNKNIEDQS